MRVALAVICSWLAVVTCVQAHLALTETQNVAQDKADHVQHQVGKHATDEDGEDETFDDLGKEITAQMENDGRVVAVDDGVQELLIDDEAETDRNDDNKISNDPVPGRRRRRRFFRRVVRGVSRAIRKVGRFVRRVVSGVRKIYGYYKLYSDCIKNAAKLAALAGDEEEYKRLMLQADEAERFEADERIKADMESKKKNEDGEQSPSKSGTSNEEISRQKRSAELDAEDVEDLIKVNDDNDELELEVEDQEDVRDSETKEEKSDAKPWGRRRRRRRRRRTVSVHLKNTCKYINKYSEWVLLAVAIIG